MKKILQPVGIMTGMFAVFGIALGLLAFVSGSWAQSQLISGAGGATEFGPIFVAVAYLQTAIVIFMLGPVIAALVAGLIGSVLPNPKIALLTGGVATLFGFYIMSVIAIGMLVISKGTEAQQALSFTQALVPMVMAGIPTAIMGSLISALSSALN